MDDFYSFLIGFLEETERKATSNTRLKQKKAVVIMGIFFHIIMNKWGDRLGLDE